MKNYELMVIFKPNLDADEISKVIDKMDSTIKDLGGKVVSVDKTGRKKLAYDIAGNRDGFFSTIVLSLPENQVSEFKRQLNINDNVIRSMFTIASDKVTA
ncbi:30S ribosomal protein S6 [bacterium]|nr:30S ribosomal protein S6 [bacterium]